MTKHRLAVMVIIETDDERLAPETIDLSTAAKTAAIRRAVVANLPNLTRVVMVMPEEAARLMLFAHNQAARESGLDLIQRPPADYVAPTRE